MSDIEKALAAGYGFDAPAVTFGAGMDGDTALAGAQIRVPLSMMNRHGLVAGATGTGEDARGARRAAQRRRRAGPASKRS